MCTGGHLHAVGFLFLPLNGFWTEIIRLAEKALLLDESSLWPMPSICVGG